MAGKTDPTESLRQVPLFNSLDKKELGTLAKLVQEHAYEPGSVIVKSGEGGHGLYIIREGKVSIIQDGKTVATMGPGQFFGEIAVLDGGLRTADVRAEAPTVCYVLISWEVKPVLMQEPGITYKMLLEMVKRLRNTAPQHQH
jgi:CRP-like cAMP-binding protein